MWTHGLPDPAAFNRLVYSRPADCLAASMTVRGEDGTPFEALYARRAAERDYRRLDLGGPNLSFTGLVACSMTPEIVFNRMAQRSDVPRAFDWYGLVACDLATGRMRTLLSPAVLSAILDGRKGWIADLVAVDGDASRIVASVGSLPVEASSAGFSRTGHAVRYALCDIDLRVPALREITRLSNAFL